MARNRQMPIGTPSSDRPPPAPLIISAADLLSSFSSRLSELQGENEQVLIRAKRTEEMCLALSGDIAVCQSRLQVESAERMELLRERDELARELAQVKHRERRRVHGNNKGGAKPTTISPTSVLQDAGPSQRKASVDSNSDLNGATSAPSQVNQPLVITDKDGNQIDLSTTEANSSTKNDKENSWKCNACTFENAPTAKECEMCGTQCSLTVKATDSTSSIKPMLLEIGYSEKAIDEALEAMDQADKDKPESVIFWIDEKEKKARLDEQRLEQEKLEKQRKDREREANERAARKKSAKEFQEKARRKAELAEERKAREVAEKLRREAREAKERARREAEERARMEQEGEQDQTTDSSATSVEKMQSSSTAPALSMPKQSSSLETPVAVENASIASQDTISSSKAQTGVTTLVKPSAGIRAAPLRNKSSSTTTVEVDKLSQFMYMDILSPTGPSSVEETSISPIFGMLQDKSTIDSARKLLSLEDRCARLKHEVENVRREKDSLDRNIASLKAEEAGLDEKLETRQIRIKNHVKRETDRKNRMPMKKATIEQEIRRLEGLKTEMKECEAKFNATKEQLDKEKLEREQLEREQFEKEQEESKDNVKLPKTEREKTLEKVLEPQKVQLPKTEREKTLENVLEAQRVQLAKERAKAKAAEKEMKKYQSLLDTILQINHDVESMPTKLIDVEIEIGKERERLRKSINEMQEKSTKAQSKLKVKMKLVERKRDEIVLMKQTGEEEEARFDIDGSRDERGHTFLMISVQNNDLDTARLCFQLGASPDVKCIAGLTAMDFAKYFSLHEMAAVIAQNGGNTTIDQTWSALDSATKALHPIDWETQLQIAERAAIPADTKLSSEDKVVGDDNALLPTSDRRKEFPCFDASLLAPNETHFRRVSLLEKDVYLWFSEAEVNERSDFCTFLGRLQSSEGSIPVSCHRRFVVGIKREKQFEVLCSVLSPSSHSVKNPVAKGALVVFYSPFVESYIHGVANIGVLLWAVTTESKASRYISLIEDAEFLRHKVDDPEERFPPHRDGVLELGKDMHLLDLKATSIFTGSAMELLTVDIDNDDLGRMENEDFIPKKRLLHHEQQMRQAIFRSSEKESDDNQGVLTKTREDLSTNLFGGAGTGKTMILIQKCVSVSEDPDKRVLVVSRLSRLISFVKSAVGNEKDTSNISFFTYEDLLNHLSRRVNPIEESAVRTFAAFNQVHFGEMTGTGAASSISFEQDFVENFLEEGERNAMKKHLVEPITLWGAFRVIKSNVKCSETKVPLSREDYLELPRSFGLDQIQRALVYQLYLRYSEWLNTGSFKWDEADRTLYIFQHGLSVFSDREFISWEHRAFQLGETDLLEDDDMPLAPFFYHMVFADEAQDFSDLDLALFIRMSSSVRNLFLGADPAQSVELGIRMRVGTVNSAFHSCLPNNENHIQVKNVLQDIQLKTNHRTHARNLAIGKAVRKILTRSFGVPATEENALMEGTIPEALLLKSMRDVGDEQRFRGGNVVFIAPDEMVGDLRSLFLNLGVKNDVFGVREAKGLEFPSIALIGFFQHFQQLGNQRQWENIIRWLFSTKGVTTTESAEKIQGKTLENCDYVLSHPEIEDQAMMLYTAMTRARGHLYFIEVEVGKKGKGKKGLADFCFRQLQQLRLLKVVSSIDEGEAEMTPQQHKARGVLLVVQAINLSRNQASTNRVKEKFAEARSRFQVDTGNDKHLLDQCNKHLDAILMKRALTEIIRNKFFCKMKGEYDLQGRFGDVLQFEREAARFFRLCANDSFLVEEIQEMRSLIEDVFYGTPYQSHFGEICKKIQKFES